MAFLGFHKLFAVSSLVSLNFKWNIWGTNSYLQILINIDIVNFTVSLDVLVSMFYWLSQLFLCLA